MRVSGVLRLALCPVSLLFAAGCSGPIQHAANLDGATTLSGSVHGGQQPVAGATIQLWAVGSSGDGSAATPLLTQVVVTDAGGGFSITGDYTCPTPSTLVYLTATGGNPGIGNSTNNLAIAEMAGLGACGALSASTFISVNELTTIGSLAGLYPYATSYAGIGSSYAHTYQIGQAFTNMPMYFNVATGTVPGPALPATEYGSSTEIDTLGNILSACINSAGGVAGDHSACGDLMTLATPAGGTAPTDTIGAVLNILKNPTANVSAIYNMAQPAAPFQPSLAAPPQDWTLPLLAIPLAPTFENPPGQYVLSLTATLENFSQDPTDVIYYTVDGTTPTTSSAMAAELCAHPDHEIYDRESNDCAAGPGFEPSGDRGVCRPAAAVFDHNDGRRTKCAGRPGIRDAPEGNARRRRWHSGNRAGNLLFACRHTRRCDVESFPLLYGC